MQALAIGPIFTWSRWQPDRKMFFSSYLLARDGGNVAFDPLPLDAGEEAEIRRAGRSCDDSADESRSRARRRADARALRGARAGRSYGTEFVRVDAGRRFRCSVASAARGLRRSRSRVPRRPAKSRSSSSEYGAAIVGDALLGTPAGALSFLPEKKLADRKALAMSLRRLWALQPRALLLGDGTPLFAGVDEALARCWKRAAARRSTDQSRRTGVGVVRRRRWALQRRDRRKSGLLIGARKLGYRRRELPPGARFCPCTPTIKKKKSSTWLRASRRFGRCAATFGCGRRLHGVSGRGSRRAPSAQRKHAPCTRFCSDWTIPTRSRYYPDSQNSGFAAGGCGCVSIASIISTASERVLSSRHARPRRVVRCDRQTRFRRRLDRRSSRTYARNRRTVGGRQDDAACGRSRDYSGSTAATSSLDGESVVSNRLRRGGSRSFFRTTRFSRT